MTFLRTSILLSILLLASTSLAAAESVRLLPAKAGDLSSGDLVAMPMEKGLDPGTPREPVTFTFALPADKAIEAAALPFQASSREYFVDVAGAELAEGVEIFTTAPGALIRISPAADAQFRGLARGMTLDPAAIVLEKDGQRFSAADGASLLVDAEKLATTGVPFAEGTVALRLADDLGFGTIRIAAPEITAGAANYTLHVFDRASTLALELGTERADYLHGQTLRIEGSLDGTRIQELTGYVTSPGGRAYPIDFRSDADSFLASLPIDALKAPGRGLWEAHVAARGQAGDLTVMRSARTSFAAHIPTAGLSGDVAVRRDRQALTMGIGVEVATAGRYEVRGVLYGTDRASGEMRPLAAAHAADWLDAAGVLSLELGTEVLKASGLEGPYELRHLLLLDQGRMGVLHRQAEALRLDLGR